MSLASLTNRQSVINISHVWFGWDSRFSFGTLTHTFLLCMEACPQVLCVPVLCPDAVISKYFISTCRFHVQMLSHSEWLPWQRWPPSFPVYVWQLPAPLVSVCSYLLLAVWADDGLALSVTMATGEMIQEFITAFTCSAQRDNSRKTSGTKLDPHPPFSCL